MRYVLRCMPVCALFAACTTVREVQPSELSRTHAPTRVWATLSDHSMLMLDSAVVQGDTLIGKVDGGWRRLPLANGETLHAREPSQSRTVALVAVTVGATAAGSWYLLKQDGAPGSTPHPCFAACALEADSTVANCYCC
jgi:hypothetical protein